MAGPFPGMDPYIESQAYWPDFHNRLVAEICNLLGVRLPEGYVARVDERIEVVGFDGPTGTRFLPDVAVLKARGASGEAFAAAATATIEPSEAEVVAVEPDEVRHSWVEVRRLPDMSLVTAIELLSPVNKFGSGRDSYLKKRAELHAREVNLVEIDLLLAGERLPMKPMLGPGHYLAVVTRAARFPKAEVYRWPIRDRLPALPIPLREPDRDVGVDLQELVGRVYDLGRYARTLRHGEPLPEAMTLSNDDRGWAERVATHAV